MTGAERPIAHENVTDFSALKCVLKAVHCGGLDLSGVGCFYGLVTACAGSGSSLRDIIVRRSVDWGSLDPTQAASSTLRDITKLN